MPIADRNLAPGTRLVATYKKQEHYARVMDDGKIVLLKGIDDVTPLKDITFKSPSSAGSAIMGGIACNGWRFWSLAEGEQPVPSETAPAPKAKTAHAAKVFYRNPNQRGLDEGQTRYYCNACASGFVSDQDVFACPNGHRSDDAELLASL